MKSTKHPGGAVRFLRTAAGLASLLCASSRCGVSAGVVFIRSLDGSPAEARQIEIATQFYGLNLIQAVAAGAKDGELAIRRAIGRDGTVAVAIASGALGRIDRKTLLNAIGGRSAGSVPVLILGVTPDTDAALLNAWSGGTAAACARVPGSGPRRYGIGRVAGMTRQLTGVELPITGNGAVYFVPGNGRQGEPITTIRSGGGGFPVFIEAALQQTRVFLACAPPVGQAGDEWNVDSIMDAFAKIAPAMMFVRYFAGERGWRPIHHYANFTIDDPWLREPYGHLRYKDLLAEMTRHNFHSTIAFIPWNYDRSEPEAASLIRSHPDRFSICVHGDNHDHKEFTDYRSKPMAAQVHSIRQSLARMERFREQTGVGFDRVMVFPHSIAPEDTLAALKRYNYLATINSSNVPMDRSQPPLLPFALRPITLAFGNFQSIRRYPPEVVSSDGFVAMNQFLDNPLFFYCHQDFFSAGPDAFNAVADRVNRLEPGTCWRGAGEIVKHSYLLKLRDDLNYDVATFSSEFCLDNTTGRNAVFHVQKPEDGKPSISAVTIDGQRNAYTLRDGRLEFAIAVPAGKTRTVAIGYRTGPEPGPVSPAKGSVYVYILRMASDFRDIGISRYAVGRKLIRLYSAGVLTHARTIPASFLVVSVLGFGAWRLWKIARRARRTRKAAMTAAPHARCRSEIGPEGVQGRETLCCDSVLERYQGHR